MRVFSVFLFVLCASGFAASALAWRARANLPYNEAGRYFDGLVVYEEQGATAYLVLAVIFCLASLLSGVWAWKRFTASKAKASSTEDVE